MQKIYSRINWENFPSEKTAVNESNLNKMDLAIDNLDDRVVAMDASKVDLTKANELVEEILWDESNGTLTVVKMNGSSAVIDTKLEKLAVNFTYNPQTQQLVIALDDGTVQNVDLSSLITEYEFLDSDTIAFEIAGGKVKAIVKNGSITENHLAPEYLAEIRTQVGRAEMSAKSADASEKNAASSSALAKSYAVGGTGTREGEDTDNAKYYAEQAKNASDVGALSKIVDNHISDKIVHMTESEHGVVSKLGESAEGSLTYNGSEIKPSVATTESTGVVKPDGTTITIDEDGTLHGVAEATVDDTISSESTNPVQNKVVKAYVDKKASENVDFSTSTSKLLNDSIEAPLVLSNATRNLLNPTLQTVTENGVTCTNNGDGTYTLNGTASGNTFFNINTNISLEVGKEYKIVGCKDNKISLVVRHESVNDIIAATDGNTDFIADENNIIMVYVYVNNGIALDNVLIKPMLTTDLSATYDDFVPYSGYDIKTCGKNLLNPTLQTTTLNGVTCTNNGDGTYTLNGTATKNFTLPFINREDTLDMCQQFKGKFVKFISNINDIEQLGHSYMCIGQSISEDWTKWGRQINNGGIDKIDIQIYGIVCDLHMFSGDTFDNVLIKPMLTTDLNATYDDFVQYQDGGTVHIDSTTKFPLLGLKSFDGETNIISPGNVEVTYAKSDSGAAIVDTLKKSVSDGKTKVANAITAKGVTTATDATFDVMAENISKIETGGGELHGATLAVSTEESTLFGQTVTLTLNGASVGTTEFADNGTCSFVVQNPGTYTITCGEAHEDVTVTGDNVLNKTVISVNLSLLKIVTFADGTDKEIAKMVKAHYNNKINISDYWAVGDTRSVSLSAMSATGVGESHRAQTVQFVIGDFEHDDLATAINGHTKAAITLLQKDCLMDATSASNVNNGSSDTERGYMNSTGTNAGGWKNCARRTWCNNVYFNALPSTWQSMVKTVNKKTSVGNNSSAIETVQDKIFLAAEIEIFGSTTYSFAGEGTQYTYYKNATANRYKMPKWSPGDVSHVYWERSPRSGSTSFFCVVNNNGSAKPRSADSACGVAP